MKENLFLRFNLTAFKNAGVAKLQGKTGVKKCVIIPIDDNFVYEGNKGAYVDFIAWHNEKLNNGDTHLIKQSLPKEVRDKLSEEDRMSLATFGSVRPMQSSEVEQNDTSKEFNNATVVPDGTSSDLPF